MINIQRDAEGFAEWAAVQVELFCSTATNILHFENELHPVNRDKRVRLGSLCLDLDGMWGSSSEKNSLHIPVHF